jgi:hypothetical protein
MAAGAKARKSLAHFYFIAAAEHPATASILIQGANW